MAVRVTPVADADASHPEASARAGATAAAAQGGDEASRGVRVQRAETTYSRPTCAETLNPHEVVDSNTLRRVDGAIFVVSIPTIVAQHWMLWSMTEEDRALDKTLELQDSTPRLFMFCVVCSMFLEYALRSCSVKHSLLGCLARSLPPKGRGVPFPGEIRRWQFIAYMCCIVSVQVLNLVAEYFWATMLYTGTLLAIAGVWLFDFCWFIYVFGWLVKLRLCRIRDRHLSASTRFTRFGPTYVRVDDDVGGDGEA